MVRRIKLKGKKRLKISKPKLFLIILILFILTIFISLKTINMKIKPILFEYAELESRKMASIIINDAVSKSITQNININELFLITKDENENIKSIDFNPITVNKILTETTTNIQTNLKYLEQGNIEALDLATEYLKDYDLDKLKEGIIYEIPTGVVFGSSFLSNIGPKIPVRLNLVGDIVSYINTKITDYGINNALIEINIVLELSEQVILPFITDKIKIQSSIPVALKLVQGNVPQFYSGSLNQNSSSFALPIE